MSKIGRALDLKAKDLIGPDQTLLFSSEPKARPNELFLHWINSFLHCLQKQNCTVLSQSESSNFVMYIIIRDDGNQARFK